jgi:F420-dependent oxidoreductase-like protein
MATLEFGLQTSPQYVSYGELLSTWQRADALGYNSAWLFDHFMPIFADPNGPCFEGLTMLTALAVQTKQIHCGCLVTAIGYRNPGLLAKMGATLDVATAGRFEMALGAGWFEAEARAFNIPFPSAGERLKQLEEGLQILRALWTSEFATFHGQHFHIENARCDPKPIQKPTPRLWVGGQGEKVTLRIVAQHADGWDMDMTALDQYKRKLDILAGHCNAHGRDPNSIIKMIHFPGIISKDEGWLRAKAEGMAHSWNTSLEDLKTKVLVGTPNQCAEQLRGFVDLGVTHFVLNAAAPHDLRMIELFIGEVAPQLR